MPALIGGRTPPALAAAGLFALGAACAFAAGCKPKASSAQCDQLLERYARLVVVERHPDASAADVRAEQEREKREALGDDSFKNCSSEVSRTEFDCAMRAPNADAFEKCLE